jgi:hypothetical protein
MVSIASMRSDGALLKKCFFFFFFISLVHGIILSRTSGVEGLLFDVDVDARCGGGAGGLSGLSSLVGFAALVLLLFFVVLTRLLAVVFGRTLRTSFVFFLRLP